MMGTAIPEQARLSRIGACDDRPPTGSPPHKAISAKVARLSRSRNCAIKNTARLATAVDRRSTGASAKNAAASTDARPGQGRPRGAAGR